MIGENVFVQKLRRMKKSGEKIGPKFPTLS
jgi:hypothetical protein